MTIKRYLEDRSLTGRSIIIDVMEGERNVVRMRDTWFHPQGGGQKGDRGLIGLTRVMDTRHSADCEVDHVVDSIDGILIGDEVILAVDADFRSESARYHSGGHLLAVAAEIVRPGIHPLSGHHWAGEARVEFDATNVETERFHVDITRVVGELIEACLPIKVVGDPFASRAVKIGDFPPVGCGGTHAVDTGELSGLLITAVRIKGGRLRVSYAFE